MAFIFTRESSYVPLLGILFAILHEMGHLAAMMLSKEPVRSIFFGLVNIGITSENCEENLEKNIFIFASGPLVNLILALCFFIFYNLSGAFVFKTAVMQNLFLAGLNLLPISSLDGGKIFKIILLKKFDFALAEKISSVVSIIFLVPVFVCGFLVLFNFKYNFSLLIIGCYLISYIFCRESKM